jgi:hypothetical protein
MRTLASAAALLLSACALSQAQPDVPAVIVDPSAASHAELLAAVTKALGVSSITIADDALTADSTLIIERSRILDSNGRQLSGRDYGKPEIFSLVKNGNHCVLVRTSDASRQVLAKTSCRRNSSKP